MPNPFNQGDHEDHLRYKPFRLDFRVVGVAKPAGSKRAFALRKGGVLTGRVAVADACAGSRAWKDTVSMAAQNAMRLKQPAAHGTPLFLKLTFHIMRPKGHFRRNGELSPSAPAGPTTRPDLLKLARAVEDALTGVVYADDSQIVVESLYKVYCAPGAWPYVHVEVAEL
jgi:crossover junction endodeoxyribonuclease RusA